MQMVVALGEGCFVSERELKPGRLVVLPAEGVAYTLRGNGDVVRIAQAG
jgi:hypothetical protein